MGGDRARQMIKRSKIGQHSEMKNNDMSWNMSKSKLRFHYISKWDQFLKGG